MIKFFTKPTHKAIEHLDFDIKCEIHDAKAKWLSIQTCCGDISIGCQNCYINEQRRIKFYGNTMGVCMICNAEGIWKTLVRYERL